MMSLRAIPTLLLVIFGQFNMRSAHPPTDRYDDYFRKFSKRYFGPGFSWRIFKAQAMAESGLDSTAHSYVGARGLMQLMPATFEMIRAHWHALKSVEDAQSNIAAGVAHDADLWQLFKKIQANPQHYRFMMGAYNAGEGTIMHAQRVAHDAQKDPNLWMDITTIAPQVNHWRYHETLGYVDQIARNYQRLQQMDAVPPLEMDLERP